MQDLGVKTASDTIVLLEENKSSSEEIKLEASKRTSTTSYLVNLKNKCRQKVLKR
ncbi:hypothetical protein ACFU8X_29185 [Brevibacillus porteri]|uniref:hypothetical protein n=1 Tax=Brevibacillus porteri TaxID=2126350 RepID=UPI00370A8F3B